MIKAAAERGWIDEESIVREVLTGIKRAGADLIITYFACDFAQNYRFLKPTRPHFRITVCTPIQHLVILDQLLGFAAANGQARDMILYRSGEDFWC